MRRFLIIATLVTLALAISMPSAGLAYTKVTRSGVKLNEKMSDQSQNNYRLPKEILITRVSSANLDVQNNSTDWYSYIYYYCVTRLGFVDMPFNYLIDRSGKVFEGKGGGAAVAPLVEGEAPVILIAYMSNSADMQISAQNSFSELLTEVSKQFGIGREGIKFVDIDLVKTDGKPSLVKTSALTEPSIASVNSVLDKVSFSSTPSLKFTGKIADLKAPTSIVAGERLKIELTVENNGNMPWLTDTEYIYLQTKGGIDSEFAVNGVWDSFKYPLHIENEDLVPGGTKKIEFEMVAPLIAGDYAQSFEFARLDTGVFEGTGFEVKFKVEPGNFDIVEVLDTETGKLNVRETAEFNGKLIAEVNPGQLYILVERNGAWYKIKYNGKDEGWVLRRYVREL